MQLTQGALFRHFPNKEAIWQAVMQWVAEQLLGRLIRAAEGKEAKASSVAALRAMFLAHIGFVAEHPGVPRMMFGGSSTPCVASFNAPLSGRPT